MAFCWSPFKSSNLAPKYSRAISSRNSWNAAVNSFCTLIYISYEVPRSFFNETTPLDTGTCPNSTTSFIVFSDILLLFEGLAMNSFVMSFNIVMSMF